MLPTQVRAATLLLGMLIIASCVAFLHLKPGITATWPVEESIGWSSANSEVLHHVMCGGSWLGAMLEKYLMF